MRMQFTLYFGHARYRQTHRLCLPGLRGPRPSARRPAPRSHSALSGMPRYGSNLANPARAAAQEGEAPGVAAANVAAGAHFWPTVGAMATKTPTLADCPTCRATGKVESRLPFRQKTCDDCGGRARITVARREQILKRSKERGSG